MTIAKNTRQNPAAANAAAESLAQSAVQNAKEKAKVAIFTREGASVNAILFINTSTNERAPLFGGSIQGTKVSAFLRTPADAKKKPFLSFVTSTGDQVATANAVVRKDGTPTLKAVLYENKVAVGEAWFSLSRNVSPATLALMGVDLDRLNGTEKAAPAAPEAKAPAPVAERTTAPAKAFANFDDMDDDIPF